MQDVEQGVLLYAIPCHAWQQCSECYIMIMNWKVGLYAVQWVLLYDHELKDVAVCSAVSVTLWSWSERCGCAVQWVLHYDHELKGVAVCNAVSVTLWSWSWTEGCGCAVQWVLHYDQEVKIMAVCSTVCVTLWLWSVQCAAVCSTVSVTLQSGSEKCGRVRYNVTLWLWSVQCVDVCSTVSVTLWSWSERCGCVQYSECYITIRKWKVSLCAVQKVLQSWSESSCCVQCSECYIMMRKWKVCCTVSVTVMKWKLLLCAVQWVLHYDDEVKGVLLCAVQCYIMIRKWKICCCVQYSVTLWSGSERCVAVCSTVLHYDQELKDVLLCAVLCHAWRWPLRGPGAGHTPSQVQSWPAVQVWAGGISFSWRASCFNVSLSFCKGHHVSMFPCLLLALERLTEEWNLVYLCDVVKSNCQQGMLCMLTATWPCSPGHQFLSFVSASCLPFAIETSWDCPVSFVSILFLPLLLKHHGTAPCLLFQSNCFFLYYWNIMGPPSVFCFNLVSLFYY